MARDLDNKDLLLFMAQKKSPGVCAVVELVGCVLGFSGIGMMLGGSVGLGIVALFGYWLWLGFWTCVGLGTLGLGFFAIPLWWLLATISAAQSAQSYNANLLRVLVR